MAQLEKGRGRFRQRSFLSFGPSKYLAAGRLGGGVISAGWLVVIARSLTKEDFAVVVLVLSMSSLTSVLHDGGQCLLLTRQISEFPSKRIQLFRLVLIRRLKLALSGVLLGTTALTMIPGMPLSAVISIAPSILATVVYTTVFSALRAGGRVGLEATNEFLSRLGLFTFGIVASTGGLNAAKVIFLYSLIDVISMTVVVSRNSDFFRSQKENSFTRNEIGNLHWRGSVMVSVTSAVGVLVARIDPIFISLLSTQVEVAKFAIGLRLVEFSIVPIGAFVAVRIAEFARVESGARLKSTLATLLVYAMIAIVILELFAPFLSDVFGEQYVGAMAPLRISAISIIPMSCSMVLLGWLTVRRPRFAFTSILVGLLSAVILHLSVTARYGAVGGAIVNLATNMSIAMITIGLCWHQLSSEKRMNSQVDV